MKKYTRLLQGIFIITIFLLIFFAGPVIVLAGISEPDYILYGNVSANQKAYTSGTITLMLNGNKMVECEISSNTGEDRYIIRIPMDGSNPRNPNSARTGEIAKIYFNNHGYLLGQITIGEKGKASSPNIQG
jgi:hypothetical protein